MGVGHDPRILISRLSHIGDAILTMPLANALRVQFPRAYLCWVVESPADQLLRGHEALDQLIVLRRGWLKSPRQVWRLRSQLRSLRFDIALDPQSLTKSAVPGWLSGAPRRIGFAAPQGRELSLWLNRERIQPQASHIVDRQLELLRPLGIRDPHVQFHVPEDHDARVSMHGFVEDSHLLAGFAVINTGAGWDSKLWPAQRYAEVAAFLGEHCELPSVVAWAGDRERQWAEQTVAGSNGYAQLAPRTSLAQLAALLRLARLFVGSDTGPLHLAAAVGTPCVAMHGPTRPQDCGPYGAAHLALQEYYQEGTSRQRRGGSNDAMRAISASMVQTACRQILARARPAPGNSAA